MSQLTATPLKTAPPAANQLNLPAHTSTAWGNGAWVQLLAATGGAAAIAGLVSSETSNEYEVDIGTGAAGAEVVVTTLRLQFAGSGFGGANVYMLPAPVTGIASGARLAARLRARSPGASINAAILYYETLDGTNSSALPSLALPPAANSVTVTPSGTAWANSTYVEVTSGLGAAASILGLAFKQAVANVEGEWDLATGAAGAEAVITTVRFASAANANAGGVLAINLPAPYPIAAATRVAVRLRKSGTSTTVYTVALMHDGQAAALPNFARLSQLPIEAALLSDAPIDIRLSQVPIEVLTRSIQPGWKLFVDGVDRTAIVDALTITTVLNERTRASIVLADFIPPKGAEVISYARDGFTPMFGGIVMTRAFAGRNQYDSTFTCSIECADWFTYGDYVYTNEIYDTPVTLKQVLQDLVDHHLNGYGITLDPAQADGPNLAPFLWRAKRVSDAIRELSERTGFVARVNAWRYLRLFQPGEAAAPYELTEAAPNSQELTWTDSDRAGGAPINKVTIICGPTGQREVHDERHYGDGVTRIFPLYAPFVAVIGALHIYSEMAGGYPLAICGIEHPPGEPEANYPYCYNPATNAVEQRADQPVIVAGDYFFLWYLAEFPFQVSAQTGATPIIEHIESRTDILSIPAGQEVANTLLSKLGGGSAGAADRDIAITTDLDGFEAGQALTINLPTTRSIAGDFVITEVSMTIVLDTSEGDTYWQYTLKAAEEATVYQGSYLDDWRRIIAAPSTVTEVAAPETRTLNLPTPKKPGDSMGHPRYIQPGVQVPGSPRGEPKE